MAPMDPGPGDRIGPYGIVAALGAGGMGRVYLARDERLERDVALKFLHDDSPETAGRLLREARAASALNQQNICHVYDVGESPFGSWIAMEYVPGDPLDKRIPPGGLPIETVLRLGAQIAAALAHAHERGIVHRDLKSANIVWGTNESLTVLDFGLAGRLPSAGTEQATRSGSLPATGPAGTIAYMAPELLRGGPADERSDLWALGVVLYEMATGGRPFTGATSYEIAASIIDAPPAPLLLRLPEPFLALVRRLLEKDPALRYRRASEVQAALETLNDHPPAPGGAAAGGPIAIGRPGYRWKRTAATVAVAILVVAGAAIWWTSRARPATLTDMQLVSTFEGSHRAPAFSPDGKLLAFVAPDARGISQVWVTSLSGSRPIQITSGETPAERPRWDPTNGQVVFTLRGKGIWVVEPLGGTPRRLVEPGFNPNFSRDGRWLTYETVDDIWIAAADGSGGRQVGGVPHKFYAVPRMPALSPDGRQIAFFHAELGPNGDLWVVPAGDGQAQRLTFDLREGSSPVWTRDGRRIIFSSARAGSRTLWQVSAAGGEPQPLTTGSGEDDEPDVSSDGTRLIFTNVKNQWQVRRLDASGAEYTVVERRTEMLFPMFSPDGRRIAFFGRADWAVAIFTVASDGSDLRQLTGGRELNHQPRWSADGEFVYFYQSRPDSFRRVTAVGGVSTEVFPWDWETSGAVQFDPTGRWLVFFRSRSPVQQAQRSQGPVTKPDAPIVNDATIIKEVASGIERELPQPPLHYPRFSRDGQWVAGSRRDGIAVCPFDGGACRLVVEDLKSVTTPVAWSGDGSRIYFMRGASPVAPQELWSVALDGRGRSKHREIGPFRGIDRFFDVSIDGDITWAPFVEGRRELWSATMK